MKYCTPFYLKLVYVILAVSIVFSKTSNKHLTSINKRIIGGSKAYRHQFPHMVSICIRNSANTSYFITKHCTHICGGAIISRTWIVTAGRCFSTHKRYRYEAVAGILKSNEQHKDIQIRKIDKIIIHPQLNLKKKANDIALVRVDQPFTYTKAVKNIKLPKPNEEFQGNVISSGWGLTTWEGNNVPRHLKFHIYSITHPTVCHLRVLALLLTPFIIADGNTCIFPKPKETAWEGDYGNPVIQGHTLVGVVSYIVTKCILLKDAGLPILYTELAYFYEFIKQHAKLK